MTSKFLRVFLAVAVTLTISAVAQTGSAPATGAAATPPTTAAPAVVPAAGPTKVGTINIEGAIFGCNEGRREEEGLQKKYEPKQAELKNQNDELEGLKKQLTTTQDSVRMRWRL
jgi:outer membrane protein